MGSFFGYIAHSFFAKQIGCWVTGVELVQRGGPQKIIGPAPPKHARLLPVIDAKNMISPIMFMTRYGPDYYAPPRNISMQNRISHKLQVVFFTNLGAFPNLLANPIPLLLPFPATPPYTWGGPGSAAPVAGPAAPGERQQ